ncbi:MAG: Fic family protein [Armatimonadetes bacterium]|nr:Fic family protein [Armatimonadota bacterium]
MHTLTWALKTRSIPSEIAVRIETVAEYKGKQELYLRTKPEVLDVLRETVISQSTAASNALEGVEVPPRRLQALMAHAGRPRNRPEEEIAGYRDALRGIDDLRDPERMPVGVDTILAMHRDLYRYTTAPNAGRWKSKDNVIEAHTARGKVIGVVFRPPAAAATPRFMTELCTSLARARSHKVAPAPIIIAAFALDFLCIHPFDDGNGRVARLLTHLLLLQEGYVIGRYVPLERLILETKNAYYAALRESSEHWHDAVHNPDPWVRYLLDIFIRAYREMETRVRSVATAPDAAAALVRDAALSRRRFTAAELLAAFPKVSRAYVYRVLKGLVDEGRIRREARGAYRVTAG